MQRLDGVGLAHRAAHAVGEPPIGTVRDPLRAAGRGLAGQRLDIDGHRRAAALRGPDGDRAARRRLQPEAHHGLVDRADVLDVEGAVGDALAVEDQQLLQHPVDGAVGHRRRLDAFVDLAGAGRGAALQEGVAVGVEEGARARRQGHGSRPGAVVDHAEQDEELRPGAVALVHRVRVQRRILPQSRVQPGQRVGAEEGRILRQQVALFGVEQEDEPQRHGEQSAVDRVGRILQRLPEQRAAGGVVGGLEAAQQLVERVQHLFGEPLADLVLILPAVGEQRGEPPVARDGQQPRLAEQQAQGGGDGPTGGLDHVGYAEVEPARALAARSRDEAQCDAVEQQPRRDAGVAQQALHARLG